MSSTKGAASGTAAKTLSLGKRKHTDLDFHHGPEDALPSSVMSSTSSDEDVSSGNAAKTLSLGKRKHTALDFHHSSEDTFPSSGSRALRPLPRRGRSRKTAAPLEGLTDATATAVAQERVRSPIEIELVQDGESGAARSEGEGPLIATTVVSRDDSTSTAAPPSKRLRLSTTSSACDSSGRAGSANALPPSRDDDSLAPITTVLSCGHCGSKPARVYNSTLLCCEVCPACYAYERRNSVSRPQSLFQRADKQPVSECANCRRSPTGASGTKKWLRSKLVIGKLCGACYQYERTHSKCRPLELVQRMQARDDSIVVKCANCQTNVTYGTWYNSVLKPGSKMCGACQQYERTTCRCRPPYLYEQLPRLQPLRCYNCGEKGELACYECSIYSLAHGFARPLSKDAIKKRRARALREERVRNPYNVSNAPNTTLSPPRQCSNCLTKTNRDWTSSRLVLDWTVCLACARYEKKYGRHRPLSLEIQRSLKLTK